jgi:hypothetical protein
MPSLTPHIAASSSSCHQNVDRNRLARIRRQAGKRGLKVRKNWDGTFTLIDTKVWPPLGLAGASQVSLDVIDMVVSVPLPPPRPSRRRSPMVRLENNGPPPSPQASHSGARSFEVLIDLLNRSAT